MWYQVTFQIRMQAESEDEVRDKLLCSSLRELMLGREHWSLDVRTPTFTEGE